MTRYLWWVLAISLWPAVLFGQQIVITETGTGASSDAAAGQGAEGGQAGDSGVFALLAKGHGLYAAGEYLAALSAYEAAQKADPNEALAPLCICYTLAKLRRYDEAMTKAKALSTAGNNRDDSVRAKALFVVAVIEEMQQAELDAIRAAWTAYDGFVQTHNKAIVYPASSKARLAALDKMQKLDEQYRVVRERIAGGSK